MFRFDLSTMIMDNNFDYSLFAEWKDIRMVLTGTDQIAISVFVSTGEGVVALLNGTSQSSPKIIIQK